jgi:hypothetical protein
VRVEEDTAGVEAGREQPGRDTEPRTDRQRRQRDPEVVEVPEPEPRSLVHEEGCEGEREEEPRAGEQEVTRRRRHARSASRVPRPVSSLERVELTTPP